MKRYAQWRPLPMDDKDKITWPITDVLEPVIVPTTVPYKVRRFNWFLYNKNDEFDYHMNNDLGRMVLNPDVVVRSRGVMEKCSMCIQMTQKTILDAKLEGETITDGEFQTACSNACSNGAMVFGDINDKDSKVAALKEEDTNVSSYWKA